MRAGDSAGGKQSFHVSGFYSISVDKCRYSIGIEMEYSTLSALSSLSLFLFSPVIHSLRRPVYFVLLYTVVSLNPLKMHRHQTGSTGDDRYRMG